MSMTPPVPRPHVFTQNADDEIILAPVHGERFVRLCDSLYPRLVSNSMERGGDCIGAFRARDKAFIGTISGPRVTSTRKNPWFTDDDDNWFLRSWAAALGVKGQHLPFGRCTPVNYGALRSWLLLGCGAKPHPKGGYLMVDLNEQSRAVIEGAMASIKLEYIDIRKRAEKQLQSINPDLFTLNLDKDLVSPNVVWRANIRFTG